MRYRHSLSQQIWFYSIASILVINFTSAAPVWAQAAPVPAVPTTADNNIQNQAQSAQKANQSQQAQAMMDAGISAGIAAMNAGPCFAQPPNMGACAMMVAGIAGIAMAAAIAGAAGTAGAGAGQTAAQVTAGSATGTPNGLNLPGPGTPAINSSTVPALGALAAKGVTYNPDANTFALPNGTTLSGAALASGDMSGTGLDSSQQSAAKSALAGIIADAQKSSAAQTTKSDKPAADNSSDLLSSSGGGSDPSSAGYASGDATAQAAAKPRAPTSVSGMKKVLDGGRDAIGVSGIRSGQ